MIGALASPSAGTCPEHLQLGGLRLVNGSEVLAPEPCADEDAYLLVVSLWREGGALFLYGPARGIRPWASGGACVLIPKSLVQPQAELLDELPCRAVPAMSGIARLLADFVTDVWNDRESLRPADGPRVGMALLGLISALLHNLMEDGHGGMRQRSGRDALDQRIRTFIQRHLRDPALTPGRVAAAHRISLSHLHEIFAEQGLTVSAWIRRQRLERARRDLADPALREVPIQDVSATWVFSHPADFSRAFRRAFGVSPSGFRRRALAEPE
ncbi:helix-turn-helix domain-containing protein [Nonomuraea diastatica]|uniref:Helix-turn-helix domain-containing protein n=1 Tax=Nonomuraea diastatica TaxID=1848329 RepID=A0A4R4X4R0_9ACTN|nr:helix-turn-helix domain-containing protein [Nonomuraea diastatica]TDD25321.1 helix-turn-helix domain-containing protein [Nonomuraea diastatica]